MYRILLLAALASAGCINVANAQGTISSGDVDFTREASPWDATPGASLTGVSTPLTDDHLFETGWALRIAGDSQEFFFLDPSAQVYNGATSAHTWEDVAGLNKLLGVETSIVGDVDGVAGPSPSGTVTISLRVVNLSPTDPVTFDLFHMADFDVRPSNSNDVATLLSDASGPLIRIADAGPNFAMYHGEDADTYLVRPYGNNGSTGVGAALGDAAVSEFDNTGLPSGPDDFTAGLQWNDRTLPPSGEATFVVRMAVNGMMLATDLSMDIADAPDPVPQGGQVAYDISVTNNGPDVAPEVIASALLPPGLTLAGTTGCMQDPAGAPDCSLGSIAANESKSYTLLADVDPGALGTVTLNASAASAFMHETIPANNAASEDTTVIQATADLSMSVLDTPDPVLAGQPLTYLVVINNAGPVEATGVIADVTLSPHLTLVSTSGCAEDAANITTCTLGTIPVAGSAQFSIEATVSPTAPGQISTSVGVSANEPDNAPANNDAIITTLVTPLTPNLRLHKSNDKNGVAADIDGWVWTLALSNAANAAAPAEFATGDEVLVDQLPLLGMTYGTPNVSPGEGVNGTMACNIVDNDLACVAPQPLSLAPGQSISVSFHALPLVPGTYINPRAGGVCVADPGDALLESNEADNACADSVLALDFMLFFDGFED